MRILITGGAGFIGSHLVATMMKDERVEMVRVLDNLSTGSLNNISAFIDHPNFEFINGDIREYEVCLEACQNMDLVCHQAALGSVPRSILNPFDTHQVNSTGTLNIFKASVENNIKRVVFASSSSVYGDSTDSPKTENNLGNCLSPYAVSKRSTELYAKAFSECFDFKYIGLRYFNVFGPRQDANSNYAAVIPLFIKQVLENESVIIHGDGLQSRDFTYVNNVVQANMLALFSESSGTNKIYNIACNQNVTVLDLFKYIQASCQSDLQATFQEERKGDIKHSLADISLAKKYLAYDPQYSWSQGLDETLAWFKKHHVDKTSAAIKS